MKPYQELSKEELLALREELLKSYAEEKAKGLKLDMSRGKPSVAQLDMGMDIFDVLNSQSHMDSSEGIDVRNYGVLDGLTEAKHMMADIMGVSAEHVIVYGNASLNVMYDAVSSAMTHGVMGHTPWCKLDKVKFLCPAPGYDRHFAITEHFGIEMITVPMTPQGPDMDMVERLVEEDESIKGIWCVPKYSNPQGYTYSDETVRRFANLKPAAGDFRIFWDNAYAEHFGIEMITVPMTPQGPDMDMVERLVEEDESIKGIWCVPKYSNPQGYTYSDETVRRFANLKPAAGDFRIFWDNAYAVHHLYDEEERQDKVLEILSECEKAGNPDMVYEFASTSKISFSGAGVAAIASSKGNLECIRRTMAIQTIGHDKINQLRHVRYFKDFEGIKAHMRKHAALMRPKFEAVESVLEKELSGLGIGAWTKPRGGYFISFDAMEGCAKAIVAKCKEAGVVLTGAGATFPYGKDPRDSNIRIAPSFPTPMEMQMATDLFVLCVKLVSVEKLLEAFGE